MSLPLSSELQPRLRLSGPSMRWDGAVVAGWRTGIIKCFTSCARIQQSKSPHTCSLPSSRPKLEFIRSVGPFALGAFCCHVVSIPPPTTVWLWRDPGRSVLEVFRGSDVFLYTSLYFTFKREST